MARISCAYIAHMDVQEIHTRLRAARLTQTELAAHLGITHSQVSRLLSGKARMRLDVFRKIEAFLAAAEPALKSGVSETPARAYAHVPSPRGITLAEARALRDEPPVEISDEDFERIRRELRELGEALKRAPRVSAMTDDEILGYDEAP
ncbi:MAG: helix-turn-helix transcriptional regulator [Hyphomonadaceae bacterium]|nr:helix-turn-helix transcriptional regulator [Hyphomonadaceae bacterium]